jgi:hypothetical protein
MTFTSAQIALPEQLKITPSTLASRPLIWMPALNTLPTVALRSLDILVCHKEVLFFSGLSPRGKIARDFPRSGAYNFSARATIKEES